MDEIRIQLKTMKCQFNFYMKHKTSIKNNLIGLLDQTYPGVNTYFDSPHFKIEARNGAILLPPTVTLTASVKCPSTLLLTIIKNGATAGSTISAEQRLKKIY